MLKLAHELLQRLDPGRNLLFTRPHAMTFHCGGDAGQHLCRRGHDRIIHIIRHRNGGFISRSGLLVGTYGIKLLIMVLLLGRFILNGSFCRLRLFNIRRMVMAFFRCSQVRLVIPGGLPRRVRSRVFLTFRASLQLRVGTVWHSRRGVLLVPLRCRSHVGPLKMRRKKTGKILSGSCRRRFKHSAIFRGLCPIGHRCGKKLHDPPPAGGDRSKGGPKSDGGAKHQTQGMDPRRQPLPETQSFSINATHPLPVHHAVKSESALHAACLTKGASFVVHMLFDLLIYFSRARFHSTIASWWLNG